MPTAHAQESPEQELPPVVVTARKPVRQAPARRTVRPQPTATQPAAPTSTTTTETAAPTAAASEVVLSRERINAQPALRPGEVLEATPGLIITQHSGEGKANQYFLRGFNLDHGTDLAITVDGMPVNMRTHGHGQGYADVNFLIPELVQSMRVRKGPYFAEEGDFASAGALRIDYINTIESRTLAGHARHVRLWPCAGDKVLSDPGGHSLGPQLFGRQSPGRGGSHRL